MGNNSTFTIDYNYEPLIAELYSEWNSDSGNIDINTVNKYAIKGMYPQVAEDILKFLDTKYGVIIDNVPSELNLISDNFYTLYNPEGTLYLKNGYGHYMVVVGTNEDGQTLVSSWGKKYIYEPSAGSTSTGDEASQYYWNASTYYK